MHERKLAIDEHKRAYIPTSEEKEVREPNPPFGDRLVPGSALAPAGKFTA